MPVPRLRLAQEGVEFLPLMRLQGRRMKLSQASLTESCADDRIRPMAVQVFDDPGVQAEQVEELDDPGSGHAQDSGYLRFRSDAGMRQLGEAASSLIQGGDSR